MLMYCRNPKKKSMEAIMKLSPKHGVASSKVLSLKANRTASKMDINECSKDGVCSREFVHNSQFMNRNHILCDYGATVHPALAVIKTHSCLLFKKGSCKQDSESKTSASEKAKAKAKTGTDSKRVSRNSANSNPASPSSSMSLQRREKQGKSQDFDVCYGVAPAGDSDAKPGAEAYDGICYRFS
ncbi:hypothetical protein Ancab_011469 [Ancistrocladus abbreviatus]